jgi:hypothetical protein
VLTSVRKLFSYIFVSIFVRILYCVSSCLVWMESAFLCKACLPQVFCVSLLVILFGFSDSFEWAEARGSTCTDSTVTLYSCDGRS